ncbi:MAG: alpha/beta hydrolase [Erythrobacter sp.]|uniref:alpha/beta hydrolase n=1 Tax=Erythrobacter sp. TaxID=1042 RepID=UPI003267E352
MKHAFSKIVAAGFAIMSFAFPAFAQPSPADLEHDEIRIETSEGLSLSGYVTRPIRSASPLPSLMLTQWVSCGSIAPSPERLSEAERIALASNYALIRIDRAGTGKSEGPGCDKLDYNTEVRHYREAFDQLTQHAWVDQARVVIFGSSLGSTTAPLVAMGKPVAGVVVQGGGALTYFERMLHFDRIQLERQPDFRPEELDGEIRRRMEFHRLYLHHKMMPDQIERLRPDLRGVWQSLRGTDAAPHYGRPYAWHWQAADQNWLAAWAKVEAPVMVVFGEYEQFEQRHGHRVIVDTINRLRPGSARWLEIPQAGHGMSLYTDPYSAFLFDGGVRQHDVLVEPVAQWLRGLS